MTRYIVLLRGINVSGKNKLPMQDLRELLSGLGYQNVQTYIQSGNIILDSAKKKEKIAEEIKKGIQTTFGYDVPVIIRTVAAWKKTIEANPYFEGEEKKVYFTFLSEVPKSTDITINGTQDDAFTIVGDVVYLSCLGGYGNTKLSNNLFERKLKVTATSRNYRTTYKLLALATES
jgi:uncharacterized protein (DUF1697 family)